jgi:hypothetical protein
VAIQLWRPLWARLAGRPVNSVTSYDVSGALEKKLREWIEDALYAEDEDRIALRLDIPDAFEDPSYLYDES